LIGVTIELTSHSTHRDETRQTTVLIALAMSTKLIAITSQYTRSTTINLRQSKVHISKLAQT